MILLDLNKANSSISLNQKRKTLFVHHASYFHQRLASLSGLDQLFAEQCFEFDEKADVLKFCPISVTLSPGQRRAISVPEPEIGALIEPATVDTRGKQHDRIAEEGTLPYGSSGRSEPRLKRPASHGEGSCARLVCLAG